MARATFVGGVLSGIVIGGGLAWAVAAPREAPPPNPFASTKDTKAAGAPGAALATPAHEPAELAGASAADVVAAERSDEELISRRLLDWARGEMVRGWREARADEPAADVLEQLVGDYRAQIETLPEVLGREAAKRHSIELQKIELFAGTDGVALLRGIDGKEPEAAAMVASERFANLFTPRGGGGAVDGPSLVRDGKVAGGAVVAFPAGVFHLQDLGRGNDPFPSDVVVRGVGMDATLLVADAQSPRTMMQRLAFEDCTIFAEPLIDARSGPSVLSLTRVRLVGFDNGAGGSYALDAGAVAIRAVACQFVGGYGRSPQGYANLLRANGARLIRFERCAVDNLDLEAADSSAVLFVDCTFTDMLGAQPSQPMFRNCRYTQIPADKMWNADYRRRDLNTLFPEWQQRLQGR